MKLFKFHKPFGVLSQFTGLPGQRTLSEFGFPKGVYVCGRLDQDSEGLLLLTDDGEFQHRMTDPKFEKVKTYWVQVENIPRPNQLEKLMAGVLIKDYMTLPCQVRILEDLNISPRIPPIRKRQSIPTCWLEIKIVEGKNRQVRRMTAAIGCPTLRLIRVKIGDYELGSLAPGEWEE